MVCLTREQGGLRVSGKYSVDYFDHIHKSTSWELLEFPKEEIRVSENWTNEQLLDAMKTTAGDLSYYNAAEGDQWERERNLRGKAHDAFYALKEMAEKRGIYKPEDFRHFLV